MKKLILFIAVIASTVSCSNDDDNNAPQPTPQPTVGGTIVATIDGEAKTFNSTNVIPLDYPAENGNPPFTELEVISYLAGDDTEFIYFYTVKGAEDNYTWWAFTYVKHGVEYTHLTEDDMAVDITTNNMAKKLVGTFNGQLSSVDPLTGEVTTFTLENGSFNIQY